MSAVNVRRPDREEMTSEKADELAEQRCGQEFSELPSWMQMNIWLDAEREVVDYFAGEADAVYDRMKEEQLFGGGNGHRPEAELEDHFLELELGRRLGK